MERISLSVPCMVLSSETFITGEVGKHILTPFGYVDVVFPKASTRDGQSGSFDVRVIGDTDSWMIDESMPPEFRLSLRKFLAELIQLCTRSPLPKSVKKTLQVKREHRNIRIEVSDDCGSTVALCG